MKMKSINRKVRKVLCKVRKVKSGLYFLFILNVLNIVQSEIY
jgi:hypothetical protein